MEVDQPVHRPVVTGTVVPVVFLVVNDPAERASCAELVRRAGFEVRPISSPESLLRSHPAAGGGCLVLEDEFNGTAGLRFLRRMADGGVAIPTVFLMKQPSPGQRAAALSLHNVVAALDKPVRPGALIRAIRSVLGGPSQAAAAN